MSELSQGEQALLEHLRRHEMTRRRLPDADSKPISHPEKYVNAIGIGSDGVLYPQSPPPPPVTKS